MDEHFNNLNSLFELDNIKKILDAGSGKTSLNYLLKKYPNSQIDAIVYPGDTRKINSIKENVKGNYNLIEKDICKSKIEETYDLVLAHLLLGEATKFNNNFENLLDKLLNINSKYFLIYDYEEDPTINYEYLKQYIKKNDLIYVDYDEFAKVEPQIFDNFLGKHYVAYLLRRTDITDIVFNYINGRLKTDDLINKLHNLKLPLYSVKQQENIKQLIKDFNEATNIGNLIVENKVSDLLLSNETYLEIANNMTSKDLLLMITNYIYSNKAPSINQELFDEMADICIKYNQKEKLWRLAFSYEYKNKKHDKIVDYFIKEKDAYYLSELIYALGQELDIKKIVDKLLKSDKEFVRKFIKCNESAHEIAEKDFELLKEYVK